MEKAAVLICLGLMLVSHSVFSCDDQEKLIVGSWENTQNSLFGSGHDECTFLANNKFECTNYPHDGDLILPFEGDWKVRGNKLVLIVDDVKLTTEFEIKQLDGKGFRLSKTKSENFIFQKRKKTEEGN